MLTRKYFSCSPSVKNSPQNFSPKIKNLRQILHNSSFPMACEDGLCDSSVCLVLSLPLVFADNITFDFSVKEMSTRLV